MPITTKVVSLYPAPTWQGELDTILYDKVYQCLVAGLWFSPDTPVSSTNKTDRHDITVILLKVVLDTITQPNPSYQIPG